MPFISQRIDTIVSQNWCTVFCCDRCGCYRCFCRHACCSSACHSARLQTVLRFFKKVLNVIHAAVICHLYHFTDIFAAEIFFWNMIFVDYLTKIRFYIQYELTNICSGDILYIEQENTAAYGSCNSHTPAQVMTPPTQRITPHRKTSIPFFDLFDKMGTVLRGVFLIRFRPSVPCRPQALHGIFCLMYLTI